MNMHLIDSDPFGYYLAVEDTFGQGAFVYDSGTITQHPAGVNWTTANMATVHISVLWNEDIDNDITFMDGNNGTQYDVVISEVQLFIQ